jgi:hypothetical protein
VKLSSNPSTARRERGKLLKADKITMDFNNYGFL